VCVRVCLDKQFTCLRVFVIDLFNFSHYSKTKFSYFVCCLLKFDFLFYFVIIFCFFVIFSLFVFGFVCHCGESLMIVGYLMKLRCIN